MENQIMETRTYQEFKKELDQEFQVAADSFVKIGYLLKIARDTNILYESGYDSVVSFAKAEYGLSKDNVSRYIAINDRYSENGYSDRLTAQYQGYGVAKLAEMLTLPDEIIEEIGPETTRREIQEIKREIREEQEKTDIEVMMEPEEKPELQGIWEKFFYELAKKEYEKFELLNKRIQSGAKELEVFRDVFMPAGHASYMARVSGIGKLMMTMAEGIEYVTLINLRTNEKYTIIQEVAVVGMEEIFCDYGEQIKREAEEQTEKVAPVQLPEEGVTEAEEKETNSEKKETAPEKDTQTMQDESAAVQSDEPEAQSENDVAAVPAQEKEMEIGKDAAENDGQKEETPSKEGEDPGTSDNISENAEAAVENKTEEAEVKNEIEEQKKAEEPEPPEEPVKHLTVIEKVKLLQRIQAQKANITVALEEQNYKAIIDAADIIKASAETLLEG